MIMMFAGLRRGELLALTWADIDLENKVIKVDKSVEFINNKPQVKPGGKTDAATRKVYIPDILVEYLQLVQQSQGLVCPSAKGKPMSEEAWRRLWESYLAELNFRYGDFGECKDTEGNPISVKSKFQPGGLPFVIPRITVHWLRHTFITNMYLAGISLLVAKDQAGHSDIRVTVNLTKGHKNQSSYITTTQKPQFSKNSGFCYATSYLFEQIIFMSKFHSIT